MTITVGPEFAATVAAQPRDMRAKAALGEGDFLSDFKHEDGGPRVTSPPTKTEDWEVPKEGRMDQEDLTGRIAASHPSG